ncbi:ArsR/SmtB family transcription factor [Candidatus Binatus soli]|jgi:DNA-binding transcriptional ArsR family regulator|uniref:ArsR/SmtB family transcription factor n=1 Tax=Candidatus Binatus soli TaxID=1953413 RepID=UPI003D14038F
MIPGPSFDVLHLGYFDDTRIIVVKEFVSQLSALGQSGRLEIFRLLVRAGPQGTCVDEIKRRVKMPGSTLSHHLDALTRCGLLTAHRAGRFIYYAVNWPKAAKLIRFMTEDCCAGLPKTFGASPDRSQSTSRLSRQVTGRHGGHDE